MDEWNDIVKEFLLESDENLAQLDRDLIELESNPTSREILARIFRTVHTIKGSSGFLGFTNLGIVAHAGENLLSQLRDGKIAVNSEIASGLLSLVDAIRHMRSEIAATGKEGDGDYTTLLETLQRLQGKGQRGENPTSSVGPVQAMPQASAPSQDTGRRPSAAGIGTALVPSDSQVAAENLSLRVGVHQLDKLMDLVGELVLARNQILQISYREQDPAFLASSQRLNLITSELQEGVAKARMQPIGNVWQQFPRLVRDLGIGCGKKVRLEISGNETELDKGVLEAIKDPLAHLVRNAVDHGLESPEERVAAGKPEEGRLVLRAFHENGQVNIEISDDGAGIDLERVRQKALDQRLITADKAQVMEDQETLSLIFLPGFSTAKTVTNISGRGVGMDVVKTNIERVGGTVALDSQPGRGTTVRIRIPLTLAIISALMLTAGGDRYAIPQPDVIELLQFDELEQKRQIDRIQGVMVCRLRGRLLPLVFLDSELRLKSPSQDTDSSVKSHGVRGGTVVVLRTHGRQFGLVVDQVNDIQEIVVKPLSKLARAANIFAGATIVGDGRVSLILDVHGLALRSSVVSDSESRNDERSSDALASHREILLVFEGAHGERFAAPLRQVTRLEEFRSSAVEESGGRDVTQYGDEILPLIGISELLPRGGLNRKAETQEKIDNEMLKVIVCRKNGCAVGFVVENIVDVVEHDIRKDPCVVQGRVTRILDLEKIFQQAWLPADPVLELEA